MSHTLAARCTVCWQVDDLPCPECRTSSAEIHGVMDQRPWSAPPASDGYVHEWHPQCLATSPAPTANGAS